MPGRSLRRTKAVEPVEGDGSPTPPSAFTKVAKKSRQTVPASSRSVFSQKSPNRDTVVEDLSDEEEDETTRVGATTRDGTPPRAAVCDGGKAMVTSTASDSTVSSMHVVPSSFNLLGDVDTSSFDHVALATSTQTIWEMVPNENVPRMPDCRKPEHTTAQAPGGSHSARQNQGKSDERRPPADETGFRPISPLKSEPSLLQQSSASGVTRPQGTCAFALPSVAITGNTVGESTTDSAGDRHTPALDYLAIGNGGGGQGDDITLVETGSMYIPHSRRGSYSGETEVLPSRRTSGDKSMHIHQQSQDNGSCQNSLGINNLRDSKTSSIGANFDLHSESQCSGHVPCDAVCLPSHSSDQDSDLPPSPNLNHPCLNRLRRQDAGVEAVSSTDRLTGNQRPQSAGKSKKKSGTSNRWAWLVCAACFVIYCVAHGTRFASGLVYSELIKPPCTGNETDPSMCGGFGASASATAWIFSLYSGIIQGLAPLSSRLIRNYGCQFTAFLGAVALGLAYLTSSYVPALFGLFLTYGVLGGVGACLLYNACILMIGSYFKKNRATANGMALSGAGFGGVVITFVAQTVQSQSGWRSFYRYMSITTLLMLLATMALSPANSKRGRLYVRRHSTTLVRNEKRPLGAKKSKIQLGGMLSGRVSPDAALKSIKVSVEMKITAMRSRMRPRLFALMIMAFLFYDVVSFIPFFLMPDIDGLQPVTVTYIMCASLGVGSVLMGVISSKVKLNPCLLQAMSFGAMGLVCVIPVASSSRDGYFVFSGIYGLFNGAAWSLFVPTMVVILGSAHIRRYIGFIFFIGMLGTVAGPPAAGAILDHTESYRHVFLLTMAFLIAGSGLLLLDYLGLRWQAQHEQNLIHRSQLGAMMRGLAKETTDRVAVLGDSPPVRRPGRPPMLHRQSTLMHLQNIRRDAMQLLDMPFFDAMYDSPADGPMEEFSMDAFRSRGERKSFGTLVSQKVQADSDWNGMLDDEPNGISNAAFMDAVFTDSLSD
ncbi:uncharacterized protein LOC135823058 [Sycon ciliatum]|uniref:uncharacterized protein LOC135823058 n=1 Tax=Sycon ciliatum TaxID=27933 RepID=UPI0031F6237E